MPKRRSAINGRIRSLSGLELTSAPQCQHGGRGDPVAAEKMVAGFATIEKALGIYDLAQFTPKV